jgi:hypothetical protein
VKIASGSYTGDGTSSRSISIGWGAFTPNIVLVKCPASGTADDRLPVVRLNNMPAGNSKRFTIENLITTGITGFGSDAFEVGSHGSVNRLGNTYLWIALVAEGGDLSLLTYTGNGTTGHARTGAGFQPQLVWWFAGSSATPHLKHSLMPSDTSAPWTGGTVTNAVISLDADGFTLGTNAATNASGTVFYAACLRENPGQIDLLTYTGNGTNGRTVSVDLTPISFWTKANGTAVAAFRLPVHADSNSSQINSAADGTINITSLGTNDVTLGTGGSVNTNGTIYWAWAFGAGALKIEPHLLTNTSTIYAPIVAAGTLTVTPARIESTSTLVAPVIVAGSTLVEPGLLVNASTVYDPAIETSNILAPELLVNTSILSAPVAIAGAVEIVPDLLNPLTTVSAPTMLAGEVAISSALLTNLPVIFSTAAYVEGVVLPNLLTNTSTLFSPAFKQPRFRIDVAGRVTTSGITTSGDLATVEVAGRARSPTETRGT